MRLPAAHNTARLVLNAGSVSRPRYQRQHEHGSALYSENPPSTMRHEENLLSYRFRRWRFDQVRPRHYRKSTALAGAGRSDGAKFRCTAGCRKSRLPLDRDSNARGYPLPPGRFGSCAASSSAPSMDASSLAITELDSVLAPAAATSSHKNSWRTLSARCSYCLCNSKMATAPGNL